MLYAALLCLLIALGQGCESNCATCRDFFPGDYYCLACKTNNEIVTTYGICIQDTTIPNCALYDQTLDCLTCRPTFQQSVNLCTKMYNGCLLDDKGQCQLCLRGSFFNPDTQSCTTNLLHCEEIGSNGTCEQCSTSYSLRNGICQSNSSLCLNINFDTGVCSECSDKALMIGYTCVPKGSNVSLNCYVAQQDTNITCKYCKQGYGPYFGVCRLLKEIIDIMDFPNQDCKDIQHLNSHDIDCLSNLTAKTYSNCLKIDFGFQRCLLCSQSYALNNQSQCVPIIIKLCLKMAPNGKSCLQCKPNFYLKAGQCLPYPPFCLNYSNGCTKCQPSFTLISGHCNDPNCQTANPVTGYCQICLINYQINPSGVCKYVDPNCKRTGALGDCLECLKGYVLKSNGLCGLQDNNCLNFDNTTGKCILCKPFYYFNDQGQICIPLPQNCIAADIAGRCIRCNTSFTLTSNFQCLNIPGVENCRIVSNNNYSLCTTCVDGFFADSDGTCQRLPPFCLVIDPSTYSCTQCSPNGVMKAGNCVDKNCRIFDLQGNCLACLASFQYDQLGQCIPETRDPNCKQYVFGICKSCAQRYYFDFQFNCVPVSPFCQTYDPNSGACTSCYRGYQLISNGDCTVAPFNSIFPMVDLLDNACNRTNGRGECIKCNANYNEIPIMIMPLDGSNLSQPAVNCIQKIQGNTYCLHFNITTSRCNQCVSRMFVDQNGECKSIDDNCENFTANGICIKCYPGFGISQNNSRSCVILNPQDPNCEIRSNKSGCKKCYKGFYYDLQTLICTKVNPQCATYNTSNGHCTSCYSGYELNNTECVVPSVTHPSQFKSNNQQIDQFTASDISQSFSFNTLAGCLTIDFNLNKCIACVQGYVLVNDSCVQRDLNCSIFVSPDSLACEKCYNGFSVSPIDPNKCVLSTLILPNCLKYDDKVRCLQCNNGYILTANLPGLTPSSICSLIDPNCLEYNSTANICRTCRDGSVLQGRVCVEPFYGVDPSCVLYAERMCVKCKQGWVLDPYRCMQA